MPWQNVDHGVTKAPFVNFSVGLSFVLPLLSEIIWMTFIFDCCRHRAAVVTPVKYERGIQYVTIDLIHLKNGKKRNRENRLSNRHPRPKCVHCCNSGDDVRRHRYWSSYTWWRHQMEIFSASLALCEGNPSVTGWFPHTKASDTEL